jgi:hypothetical protein
MVTSRALLDWNIATRALSPTFLLQQLLQFFLPLANVFLLLAWFDSSLAISTPYLLATKCRAMDSLLRFLLDQLSSIYGVSF